MKKILVIDIGNTSTSLGWFVGGKIGRVHRIEKAVQTDRSVAEALRQVAGRRRPDAVGIASVVPALKPLWQGVIHREFLQEPLWIDYRRKLGIQVTYPKPETIGADRLANAAGAVARYGAPVIVADFGTAVTFDLITRREGYIGGIIAPGLPLMFDYLADRTAQLPHIAWGPVRARVGKSTAQAMQLGAHWGYRGMVREIIAESRKLPALKKAALVATGGFAARVLQGISPKPLVDPTLTLFGIGCITERNLD
ncbi:MAG TPA: type III pantothenate kinase [Kiritimatiellia bacterium]|nr:type III pantothenate kinase [Kiritimatiellia bacterium]HMO98604.1 type III pantothenate kinase [Kiritimatiellia bacterium]HMP95418.1 type III pantothenate kinase [Kiritimatiellia bacterium]